MKHNVVTLLALSTFATTTVAYSAPELVGFVQTFRAGTILVRKHERQLYYVTEAGQAVRHPVGVGRIVNHWAGATYITYHLGQQSVLLLGIPCKAVSDRAAASTFPRLVDRRPAGRP